MEIKSLYLSELDCFIRYYYIDGLEPARVYLHGAGDCGFRHFNVATHHKLSGHKTLIIDFIGHGYSDKPRDFDYSIDKQAKFIIKILEKEKIAKSQIIGYSMGGTVGVFIAIQRIDLLDKLILYESNIIAGGGEWLRKFASVNESEFTDNIDPNYIIEMRKKAVEGDEKAQESLTFMGDSKIYYRSVVALVNLPMGLKSKFLGLNIPIAYVFGEKNYPENISRATPEIPTLKEMRKNNIKIGVVPKAGHEMISDNLEGYVDVLKKFVD